jgi:type II secretory pathway pseudopilin PulG
MQHSFQPEPRRHPASSDPESGFVLLAVLFLVAILMIGLTIAIPQITKSIQRDKEQELIHRGEQYKRAIKLYYKKYGAYPTSIDQLMNTNQIRFLRKRYTDPITGKDDWKLVLMGQAHLRPLGFFGQPLSVGGGVSGGIGISSGNIYAISTTTGTGNGSGDGTSGDGTDNSSGTNNGTGSTDGSNSNGSNTSSGTGSNSSNGSGSAFGSSSSSFGSSGSSFGSGNSSTFGSNNSGASNSPFSSSVGLSSSGTQGATGSGFGGSSNSSSSGSSFGSLGPFVGVVSPSTKASLIEYKKQKHYNQWEFIYDPIEDQMQAAASMLGGAGNINNSTDSGSNSTFGSSTGTGTSSFGNSFGSPSSSTGSPFGSTGSGSLNGTSGSGNSGTGNSGSSPNPNQQ